MFNVHQTINNTTHNYHQQQLFSTLLSTTCARVPQTIHVANRPTVHSFPRLKLSIQATTYLHFRQRYTRGSGFTVISDGSAFTTSIQLCGKILAKKKKLKQSFLITLKYSYNVQVKSSLSTA